MKILFVDNTGNMSAGAFHSLVALIVLLKKKGVDSVIAIPNFADGTTLLEKYDIPYIQLRACAYTWMINRKASVWERLKMPLKNIVVRFYGLYLSRMIKKLNVDVVHENTSACYIGFYAAKIGRVKHVWHIREFMEEDFNSEMWRKKKAYSYFNKSDAVIAISKAIYEKYETLISPPVFRLIYNGILVENFLNENRNILNGPVFNILCVGRISEAKSQKTLVEAAALLKKEGFLFKVTFAGLNEGPYYESLLELADTLDVLDCLHFVGQSNQMKECYAQNDILCMCSKAEAFGRVTVEAMLSGCLVVGRNSGGTKEIIQDGKTGILFEDQKHNDLYEKLVYSFQNVETARKIALQGQAHAKKSFSANANAEAVYNLYCNLLRNG